MGALRPVPPAVAPVRVLGIGDSNMSGYNCFCPGPPAEYAAQLTRRTGRPAESANLAVGGWTTLDLLDAVRHDEDLLAAVRRADVVMMTIGANDMYEAVDAWEDDGCDEDCYRPVAEAMGRRVATIIDEVNVLRAGRGTRLFVTGYWNVMQDGFVAETVSGHDRVEFNRAITGPANDAIRLAVRDHGGTWVDLVEPFVGADRSRDPSGLLALDGEHPNAAGVRRIVRAILAADGG